MPANPPAAVDMSPEAVERIAEWLAQEVHAWDDAEQAELDRAAALIRAQAAEIARMGEKLASAQYCLKDCRCF